MAEGRHNKCRFCAKLPFQFLHLIKTSSKTKQSCASQYSDTISICSLSSYILSLSCRPPPSAISPVSAPAVGETCSSTSSWLSNKHSGTSCLMVLHRGADTDRSFSSRNSVWGGDLTIYAETVTVASLGYTARHLILSMVVFLFFFLSPLTWQSCIIMRLP